MLIVTKGLPTFILLGFSLDGQNFSGHLYIECIFRLPSETDGTMILILSIEGMDKSALQIFFELTFPVENGNNRLYSCVGFVAYSSSGMWRASSRHKPH